MHLSNRAIVRLIPVLAVAALIAAACGSSSDESSSGSTTTVASGDQSCQLDGPIKLGFAWEIQGESEVAVSDWDNGANLAIEEINAAGGVCGQQIVAERVSTSTLDPQAAVASFLRLVDGDPVVILGINSQPAQDAALQQIDRSGIPTITMSPNDKSIFGTSTGSEYLWIGPARSSGLASEAGTFMVEELGVRNAGFIGTNESFGNDALAAIRPAFEAGGGEISIVRQQPPGVQDLTQDIVALQGAGIDGLFDFGYPNDIALALKQLAQNGLEVPVMDGASADIVALYQLAEGPLLENLYASVDCYAGATDNPKMVTFAKAYQDKYQSLPFAYGVLSYDMIHFVAMAIEHAGSTDHDAVNDAIGEIDYTEGACHPSYKADGAHTLSHSGIIARFKADSSAETLRSFDIDPLPEGG